MPALMGVGHYIPCLLVMIVVVLNSVLLGGLWCPCLTRVNLVVTIANVLIVMALKWKGGTWMPSPGEGHYGDRNHLQWLWWSRQYQSGGHRGSGSGIGCPPSAKLMTMITVVGDKIAGLAMITAEGRRIMILPQQLSAAQAAGTIDAGTPGLRVAACHCWRTERVEEQW